MFYSTWQGLKKIYLIVNIIKILIIIIKIINLIEKRSEFRKKKKARGKKEV